MAGRGRRGSGRSLGAARRDAPRLMRASELKRAKRDIRRSVLAARDALGEAERIARSTAIHQRFLALPELEGVRVVMGFWSLGSEVSTPPLLDAVHARGIWVCLP